MKYVSHVSNLWYLVLFCFCSSSCCKGFVSFIDLGNYLFQGKYSCPCVFSLDFSFCALPSMWAGWGSVELSRALALKTLCTQVESRLQGTSRCPCVGFLRGLLAGQPSARRNYLSVHLLLDGEERPPPWGRGILLDLPESNFPLDVVTQGRFAPRPDLPCDTHVTENYQHGLLLLLLLFALEW